MPGSVERRKYTEDNNDDESNESRTVRGYAAKFNKRSENLGCGSYQFFEVIEPGAFDDVLNDDVRALFNHDENLILARSKNGAGTLRIGTDETGLWYEFDAPTTQAGNDLLESLERGDVDQSSFSFSVDKDGQSWVETQEGDGPIVTIRTIKKFSKLYDVSPVVFPAYLDTDVATRSLKEFREAQTPEQPEPPSVNHILTHWQRRADLISKPAKA